MPAVKTVDLCEEHFSELTKLKQAKKKAKAKVVATRNKHDHDAIAERVMQFAEERPLFTAAEVARAMKQPRFAVQSTVRKLVKAGKLASVSKGAGRRLSKVA